MEEKACFELLKEITKLRYNLSEVGEELRIHDKNSDDKVKRIKYLLPPVFSEKFLEKILKSPEPILTREATKVINKPCIF